MIKIKLSQGMEALIDDEDFSIVKKYEWHVCRVRKSEKFYAHSHILINGKQTKQTMHRLIMGNADLVIDHINGNGLDNRRKNLRFCKNGQNLCNRGPQKSNKLGIKNIWFDSDRERFCVDVSFDGKRVFRGRYKTLDQAIVKRDEALLKFHGEFANLKAG